MEKEQIKQEILIYFGVSSLQELIAKTPKEWIECANTILSQEKSPFERIIYNFPEDWKIFFRDITKNTHWYISNRDRSFRWLGNVASINSDKFILFLYQVLLESKAFEERIVTKNIPLRECINDFYSLTNKEFKKKYGVSNIR